MGYCASDRYSLLSLLVLSVSLLTAYERAASLAPTDEDRSHSLAALGLVAYRLGHMDQAKTWLFQG